jgi:hypothetical protein
VFKKITRTTFSFVKTHEHVNIRSLVFHSSLFNLVAHDKGRSWTQTLSYLVPNIVCVDQVMGIRKKQSQTQKTSSTRKQNTNMYHVTLLFISIIFLRFMLKR